MFRLIFLRHETQSEDDNERNYQTIKRPNLPPECFGWSFTVHVGMVRQSSSGEGNRAQENFKEVGVEIMVTIIEGDADELVTKLKEPIEVAFIDADKSGYIDYLNKPFAVRATGRPKISTIREIRFDLPNLVKVFKIDQFSIITQCHYFCSYRFTLGSKGATPICSLGFPFFSHVFPRMCLSRTAQTSPRRAQHCW